MKVIGIDLAIKSGKTCVCYLHKEPQVWTIDSNNDIIDRIKFCNPKIVTIDAPLGFPKKSLRTEERELHKLGISVLPPNMPGMRNLTKRAVELKQQLDNYKIFEVYPYATKKLLQIDLEKNDINDSYICAITGRMYLEGRTKILGQSLLIPRVE